VETQWDLKPEKAGVTRKLPADVGNGQTRARLGWGCSGLLVGVLLSVIFLVIFAPQPQAVVPSPPAPSHIVVTVDDQYLTRLVAQGISKTNLPGFTIGNVQTHIGANNVLSISGTIETDPSTTLVDLHAQGQIIASGGLIEVTHLTGNFGGLALPGWMDSALEIGINISIANERQRLTQGGIQYSIVGVSSSDGRLTLMLTFA
jgi:hypothetical protein